jgi:hypothetical protein
MWGREGGGCQWLSCCSVLAEKLVKACMDCVEVCSRSCCVVQLWRSMASQHTPAACCSAVASRQVCAWHHCDQLLHAAPASPCQALAAHRPFPLTQSACCPAAGPLLSLLSPRHHTRCRCAHH